MHNVTHILLWRHCDSKSFTVVLVLCNASSQNNNIIKLAQYDETKKMTHDSQIVIV